MRPIAVSIIAGAALALAPFAAPESQADVLLGFQTPSGNMHCQYFSDARTTELRCDLLQNDAPLPPRPRDCDLDYGNAFAVTPRGRASRVCAGDTTANPDNPIVDYGTTWKRNGFSCVSSTTGLTCTNRVGHGFRLARKKQTLF